MFRNIILKMYQRLFCNLIYCTLVNVNSGLKRSQNLTSAFYLTKLYKHLFAYLIGIVVDIVLVIYKL